MGRTMPRSGCVALSLAALLTLAGCGSDGPEPDSGATRPPSSSPSTAEATASTVPGSATTDPEPTVAPATGPVMKQISSTLHVPEGWTPDKGLVKEQTVATSPNYDHRLTTYDDVAINPDNLPLELQAQTAMKRGKLTRQPDAVLDGDLAYHVTGSCDGGSYCEVLGLIRDGRDIGLAFDFDKTLPTTEARQIVDSVIASFRWKS